MALLAVLRGMLTIAIVPYAGATKTFFLASNIGTFEDLSARVRPKIRYWLPDASVDCHVLASNIAQLSNHSAGGIKLLNYLNYRGAQRLPPEEIDWNIYGYATLKYRQILEAALQALMNHNMIMDFCIGPQSGQRVPAEPDEIGLSWKLVIFNISLTGEHWGQALGWGSGGFVSASAFEIRNLTIIPALTLLEANKKQYIISASLLVDLTSLVSSNSSISLSLTEFNATNPTLFFVSYARRLFACTDIATSENLDNVL